jgi:chromosome segregation ATPase
VNARTESLLELAAQLEEGDSKLVAEIDVVAGLAGQAEEIGTRAGATGARLTEIPGELVAAERYEADSKAALAGARDEEEAARAAVAKLQGKRRKQDELEQAVREQERAGERVQEALARLGRAGESIALLQAEQRRLRVEAEELVASAPEVAGAIGRLSRVSESGKSQPGSSLEALVEWAARARAALFVVRGTLVGERERIAIEANAIGGAALGEQVAGAGVAQVRRRLEQELRETRSRPA